MELLEGRSFARSCTARRLSREVVGWLLEAGSTPSRGARRRHHAPRPQAEQPVSLAAGGDAPGVKVLDFGVAEARRGAGEAGDLLALGRLTTDCSAAGAAAASMRGCRRFTPRRTKR